MDRFSRPLLFLPLPSEHRTPWESRVALFLHVLAPWADGVLGSACIYWSLMVVSAGSGAAGFDEHGETDPSITLACGPWKALSGTPRCWSGRPSLNKVLMSQPVG
ncbi:unnamed protein product [Prorocentrum cordatum]|uniref:Uncharacterized protein n=1 Tax=Prorocentrum cordatum TaxID=2364126 RepID=A0ABN9QRB3_9DINO|nr:unnamed protein product [Polarella glacialis]